MSDFSANQVLMLRPLANLHDLTQAVASDYAALLVNCKFRARTVMLGGKQTNIVYVMPQNIHAHSKINNILTYACLNDGTDRNVYEARILRERAGFVRERWSFRAPDNTVFVLIPCREMLTGQQALSRMLNRVLVRAG